ncbi:hypothetical protein [Staphylococcus haemolyticus]|nr:hypothetical protein [Staphylococcus haemolyticus]
MGCKGDMLKDNMERVGGLRGRVGGGGRYERRLELLGGCKELEGDIGTK